MHLRASPVHLNGDDPVDLVVCEEPAGESLNALGGGALRDSDQNGAVADDLDVSALDGGRTGLSALGPYGEVGVRELGVPTVDRLVVDGLALPGLHHHRVDGDTVVDPAGRVAGEEVVGQRSQKQVVIIHGCQHERVRTGGALEQLGLRDPGDEHLGQIGPGQILGQGA